MAATAELKWKNTAFLVIDMQKDFISPGGVMHVKAFEDVVPNVIKAVEVARNRNVPIIWVVREHDPLGRDVELFRRHLYGSADKPKPVSKGTVGAELVDGLFIEEGDYKLVKTRFSSFFNTHLHSYLQGLGVNNLIITGNHKYVFKLRIVSDKRPSMRLHWIIIRLRLSLMPLLLPHLIYI
ncbi:hypothetical protein ABFS83_04G098600 [Erythranthe nasuta]